MIYTPDTHRRLRAEQGIGDLWELEADVCIIGSGAGGAVAAAELSRAGWKVVLIEEGSHFIGQFNNDEFAMQVRLYRDAGWVLSENQTLSILQGRTLGGSTTVNWQTSLYPPDYVTNEWRDRFGLSGYGRDEASGEFVEEVHQRLGVRLVPDHLVNRNNRILLEGGRRLGLHPHRLRNNNAGKCVGLGRCGLGCPINAKQSTFLTWIPDAVQAGAIVAPNMRAESIEDGDVKTVHAVFTPDPFAETPPGVIQEMRIHAPVVVVSAGALEGPALLQRSGLGNDWVGRNLKVHPTSQILARFDYEVDMWHGPPQSIMIEDGHNQEGTGYGFWLEVSPLRPSLTAAAMPLLGDRAIEELRDYRKLSAGICLVRDGADGETAGRVSWSGGKRKIEYTMTPTDARNMLRGLKMLAEVQAAAGAKELIFPFFDMEEPLPVTPESNFDWILSKSTATNTFGVFSAHPHGSIQAADNSARGAINPDFELYGHRNIFVMDACWIPTGLSVNPQITTMSAALRAARKLASQKGERLLDSA
ncbi:MAG: GMC family oxidoreductase [Spirochaetales bacterium]|nr:GMC family oxidoreductase [Leptospiraceae bacterium]MCP5483738.1 GMC family oxidoreductase [Spirochaetales bacterium]MCP5484777.1 GMC family oxidoreductase [Spirochaetales bacterium]